MTTTILIGDCRTMLRDLADDSVHCVVTSPPYYGMRDYGTAQWEGGDANCNHTIRRNDADNKAVFTGRVTRGERGHCIRCGARCIDEQIGLEASPEQYVEQLVAVFREVRRVLRPDGTLWLNLGDSYWGGKGQSSQAWSQSATNRKTLQRPHHHIAGRGNIRPTDRRHPLLKPKDLLLIPARVALALQADGWWLRNDVIWEKPNSMPESVRDRFTVSHEHVFLLTRSPRYFFDAHAVREPNSPTSGRYGSFNGTATAAAQAAIGGQHGATSGLTRPMTREEYTERYYRNGRNRRTVWSIPTLGFADAHFATMPPDLAELCIRAGSSEHGCCPICGAPWKRVTHVKSLKPWPERRDAGAAAGNKVNGRGDNYPNGSGHMLGTTSKHVGWQPGCVHDTEAVPCTILDPFGGAGTTALVADRLGRDAVIVELNAQYANLAARRLQQDAGLFAAVEVAA